MISSMNQRYLHRLPVSFPTFLYLVRSTHSPPLKTMAPQAFCCDKIRSTTFEAEDYRLGLFINWAKAKDKRAPTKDKNLGLNVPFCVQVFQRPSLRSTRLFVPTGWYEFAEIDWKLLGAPWVSHGYVPGEFVAGSRLIILQDRHITSAGFIVRPIGLHYTKEVSNPRPCLQQLLRAPISKFPINVAVETLPRRQQLTNRPTSREN